MSKTRTAGGKKWGKSVLHRGVLHDGEKPGLVIRVVQHAGIDLTRIFMLHGPDQLVIE